MCLSHLTFHYPSTQHCFLAHKEEPLVEQILTEIYWMSVSQANHLLQTINTSNCITVYQCSYFFGHVLV